MKNKSFILFSTICILFVSCSKKEIFSEFHSFYNSEWSQQETARFEIPIQDITASYEVFCEIRNNNDYPFQNIWLFIDIQNPKGEILSDTLPIELADMYGKWRGKGIGLYTSSHSYKENIQYPDTGTYVYTIRQGMRINPLKGISDIGLRISKKSNQ